MMAQQERHYLTVTVRGLPLALPLSQVQEVVLWVPWEPGPPGSAGLVGVVAVRGESWPVWDLARHWGWNPRDPGVETCYVLVNGPDGKRLGAVVVDRIGWIIEGDTRQYDSARGSASLRFARTIKDPETDTEHYVTTLSELTD